MSDTSTVVVVDADGNPVSEVARAVLENRAASVAKTNAIMRGHLSVADAQREAEAVAPIAINPVPESIVPFTFAANAPIRTETLNATFAHIGNLLAALMAREKLVLKALDSLTDRVDAIAYVARAATVDKTPGIEALLAVVENKEPAPAKRPRGRPRKDIQNDQTGIHEHAE